VNTEKLTRNIIQAQVGVYHVRNSAIDGTMSGFGFCRCARFPLCIYFSVFRRNYS
jgi:hypothetical protein